MVWRRHAVVSQILSNALSFARSIRLNHPDAELIILLLDERPEEVTDFEETVGSQVFASTFDESPRRDRKSTRLNSSH